MSVRIIRILTLLAAALLAACAHDPYYVSGHVGGSGYYSSVYDDFYFYPNVGVYFSIHSGDYWYHPHDHWVRARRLPSHYHLDHHRRVKLKLDRNRPWRHYDDHRRGVYDRTHDGRRGGTYDRHRDGRRSHNWSGNRDRDRDRWPRWNQSRDQEPDRRHVRGRDREPDRDGRIRDHQRDRDRAHQRKPDRRFEHAIGPGRDRDRRQLQRFDQDRDRPQRRHRRDERRELDSGERARHTPGRGRREFAHEPNPGRPQEAQQRRSTRPERASGPPRQTQQTRPERGGSNDHKKLLQRVRDLQQERQSRPRPASLDNRGGTGVRRSGEAPVWRPRRDN